MYYSIKPELNILQFYETFQWIHDRELCPEPDLHLNSLLGFAGLSSLAELFLPEGFSY